MESTCEHRLRSIDWSGYAAPFSARAAEVPLYFRRLADPDQRVAMAASHELWTHLCHQHVSVAPAAVPALPFLLEVLDHAAADLAVVILDIVLGFALCTNVYRCDDPPAWATELREELRQALPRIERFVGHQAKDADYFARRVLDDLAHPEDYLRWEGPRGDLAGPVLAVCLIRQADDPARHSGQACTCR